MMNIDVLEEQLLIFCWLSCVIPLVDLIYIPFLFLRYNLLVIEVISDNKRLEERSIEV